MAKFRKSRLLSSGGQGEVWVGIRVEDQLDVAMKYMHRDPNSIAPEEDLRRFERELRCQSAFDHPNVMPILGYNLKVDPPWYAMPLADESLRSLLAATAAMPEPLALQYFAQVLDAIQYAHSEGVLHRDLKPENVLILNGVAVVSDFGLSRRLNSDSTTLTMTNVGMGTVQYSAPEQFRDAHGVDERADIYSLGKLLFELLSGVTPFPSIDLRLIPDRYRYVVGKCVEEAPERRFQTVADLARELSLLLEPLEDLDPPLQRAQSLLGDVLDGRLEAVPELHRLLVTNSSDEVLFKKFLPYVPLPAIEAYVKEDPTGFNAVLQHFDEHVAGSQPFTYTDSVADFLAQVFPLVDDQQTRRMILNRLYVMGYEHNRWHVGQVFARLVGRCKDTSDVMMIADLLRGDPRGIEFVSQFLRDYSLSPHIVGALADK